jgi:hypothetical protein
MTLQTAIDNLMANYGCIAGLDRLKLERLISSGLSKGFSVRQCYNGVRLCLAIEYGQQEIFSEAEAEEMLNISKSELFSEMQRIGSEPVQAKGRIFYFPEGIDL